MMTDERTPDGRITRQRQIADILELCGVNADKSMVEATNILRIADSARVAVTSARTFEDLTEDLDRLEDDGGRAV